MTVQTPLDPTPSPTVDSPPKRRRGAALAVSIVTIVVGGCAILGTFASSGITAVRVLRHGDAAVDVQQSPADAVRALDIELSGGALRVEYGDVSEARLEGFGAERWTLDRHGDTLRISSPDRSFADSTDDASTTLTLPQELSGDRVDATIEVTGGHLDTEGDFGALSMHLSGGSATVVGRATAVDLSVAGGSAEADLAGATTASFDLAGGDLTATLTGATPARTTIEATGGSFELTLPDDTYRVTGDGSGTIDSALRTSPTATALIDVRSAIGSITLRAS